MNKNLKKVISAIAALALSVTSFVAMASYPDTEGHKHSSAINELSALGIIEGFEDGTFHPDELVTRAQMAKMVVSALNIANAESNKVQKFNDVAADNWAAGWVATASDKGIINGTGNGNFDPNENVTYAQTMKMLVAAAGYTTWAEKQGGWPGGYLTYGNAIGVSNNISDVSNDTALTRAQCAQMIVNALEAPMLKQTSMTTDYQGNPVALMSQMDGTNEDKTPFTSLLTENWDIYVVNGIVTDTGKADGANSDKVTYAINKTKNYLGRAYGTSLYNDGYAAGADAQAPTVLKGATAADKFLNEYTKALIFADDYSESEMVYIESAGKNEKVTFESNLFRGFTPGAANTTNKGVIEVKKSASTNSTTTYRMTDGWTLVVNGVALNDNTAIANFVGQTVNPGATVTLIDNPTDGVATDGYYDVVTVDYYVTAVVDSVVDKTNETIVYFKDASVALASISVKKDDDDYSYSFEKNGAAINVTDLAENDVLSIAYDPNLTGNNIKNSMFFEVSACDTKKEGKVTQSGQTATGETYYTIDGEDLVVAGGLSPVIKTGGEYTAYLTANGRIAAVDKLASSVNYAVLDRVYQANSGETTVRLITKDGQKVEYELYDSSNSDPDGKAAALLAVNGDAWAVRNGSTTNTGNATGLTLADRIVAYTITSGNKIRLTAMADAEIDINADAVSTPKSYTASTSKLGSKKVDDSTVVIDLTDWWTNGTDAAALASVGSFVDGANYTFVTAADDTATAAESVPFVFVTSGLGGWTVDTQMAVVAKKMSTSDNGSDRVKLQVYVNGELSEVLCEDTSAQYNNLSEGDVIIYKKDSDGYINEVVEIMNVDIASNRYGYFNAIKDGTAINNDVNTLVNNGPVMFDGEPVEYVLAPVIDKNSNGIIVGTVAYGNDKGDKAVTTGKNAWYMSEDGTDYSYDNDVKVYTYIGENSDGYKVEVGAAAAVAKSQVIKANTSTTSYLDEAGSYITLGIQGEAEQVNTIAFALMRVHDDTVKEIVSITLPDADVTAPFVGD